jgi:ATP-dependent RNA circularization protein (DNA/RNA ligase family)
MLEYPKIETLYDRDPKTFKVMTDRLRLSEFQIIKSWHITEKVDGTNIRVEWIASEKRLIFGGRTDNAQMPTNLMVYLQETFKPEIFTDFENDMILFGEGYGEKIQKGGGNYRKGVSFRLFDVLIGKWWLEPDSIKAISDKLNIETVPDLGIIRTLPTSKFELEVLTEGKSKVAIWDGGTGCEPEGIVARTHPLLFTRKGERVMWKLKFKDFA